MRISVEDRASATLMPGCPYGCQRNRKSVGDLEVGHREYPRSRVRFTAHMKLGKYLDRERAYDGENALRRSDDEDNRDDDNG